MGFVPFIWFFVAIIIVIAAIKKDKRKKKNAVFTAKRQYTPVTNTTTIPANRPQKRKMGIEEAFRDDYRNDWLAKQLQEEHIAFKKTSEMFSLKIEHASSCDAAMIKAFHEQHCDAKEVDTAQIH